MACRSACTEMNHEPTSHILHTTYSRPSKAPFLPPEIHRTISQYIDRKDLPSYRLGNRTLAHIGAEELFRTITIQYSLTSIARLEGLGKSSHLRKYVEILIWDTNSWRILSVRDLSEWTNYFREKAVYMKDERNWRGGRFEYAQYLERIGQNRQEWEAYADRLADEKQAKQHLRKKLEELLAGFDNLRKVELINGAVVSSHRGVRKIGDDSVYPTDGSAVLQKGEGLYSYRRLADIHSRPAVIAFSAAASLSNPKLAKLKIDALCFRAFDYNVLPVAFLNNNLTRLQIRLTSRTETLQMESASHRFQATDGIGHLHNTIRSHLISDFLTRLPNLESLHLDLGDHGAGTSHATDQTRTLFIRIFPAEYTWSKLRKLFLRNFDALPDVLLAMLDRHKSTLKVLKLHNIFIESEDDDMVPTMSWPAILQRMREMLQLDRACLTGVFTRLCDGRGAPWKEQQLFRDYGVAVAKFLVEGGECPIRTAGFYQEENQ